jgi:hypothetical protein
MNSFLQGLADFELEQRAYEPRRLKNRSADPVSDTTLRTLQFDLKRIHGTQYPSLRFPVKNGMTGLPARELAGAASGAVFRENQRVPRANLADGF